MMRNALLLLGILGLAPTMAAAAWQMDQFVLSAWGAPEEEATAQAYVAAGLNTVMAKPAQLPLCRRFGLRAIVMGTTPEQVPAILATQKRAVWGWYVQDEPKADQFAGVGERVAAYQAADPDHPAYVNLMAWMDLDQYFKTVKPWFLSYDYYQWWWGTPNYCWRLEAHRAAALKAGVPLLCWIEANADKRYEWGEAGAGYLADNAAKLRQSVYLALAYGVKGLQWFTGGLIVRREPNGQPRLTQSGQDIAVLNREVSALGPALLGLRSTAVYHTDPVPAHTEAVPEALWVQPRGRCLTLGLFTDGADRRFLLPVNRDLGRQRPAILSFGPEVKVVECFEGTSRRWQPVSLWPEGNGRRAVRVNLDPGQGKLLRVE